MADTKTNLEKIKEFIATFPGAELMSDLHVDYSDSVPVNSGLFPAGLEEVSRRKDILGNTVITNRENFSVYAVLEKPPGDDETATTNAEWLASLQRWIQDCSARGTAPTFGCPYYAETMTASNGTLYQANAEGVAIYAVNISVTYSIEITR